jgi:hypothetical protein
MRFRNFSINFWSVNRQNIVVGISEKMLDDLVHRSNEHSAVQVKLIRKLERELDLNQNQIQAALRFLGEENVQPERYADKLIEVAERYQILAQNPTTDSADESTLKLKYRWVPGSG